LRQEKTLEKSKIKNNKSKLKAQSSKLQLKTQNYLFCHPESAAQRISCQFFFVILNEVKDPMPASREILR